MDKEGLKKQTDKTVKAGYWRDVSEIPYIELYRVILSMEEMRLEELEDLKEYLKAQAMEIANDEPGNSILGRFYVRKYKDPNKGTEKELYHVLRVDGNNYRIIGSLIRIDHRTDRGYECGIDIKDIREETQLFSGEYWKIKGKSIEYNSGKDLVVEEISEAKFLEVWTFAKQMLLIYGKL